ncbi:MAG: DMT family transporter [Candidatus Thermoplasmatota archaeon]|nr:DMT family transporter [Candidatus Thermoplasmatota archaeon]
MHVKHIGVITILLASFMWAIEPILAKLSYQNTDFLQTSLVRALFATLTACVYIIVSKKATIKITKQQLPPVVYIAIVGTIVADLIYFYALTNVSVINAVLIGHMQPVFIIVFGFLVFRSEKLMPMDYLGIFFLMLCGILVTSKTLDNIMMFRFGTFSDVMVLIATMAWASAAIAMRKYLPTIHAATLTMYRFFIASVILLCYLSLSSTVYIANMYQVIVGIVVGIGTIFYYEGLKRLKAAQVSGIELTTPFFAAILGYGILGESLTILQIIGMFFLLGGIYLISKRESK